MNCEPKLAAIWRQLILDTQATVFARKNAEAAKLGIFRLDSPYARKAFAGGEPLNHKSIDLDEVIADLKLRPPAAESQAPETNPIDPPAPVGEPTP